MLPLSLRTVLPLMLLVSAAAAQSAYPDAEYLPPPDPGYGLYFHQNDGALEKPERWGYHDGWMQGRLDRSEGHPQNPKQQAAYTKGLRHGTFGALPEEQYLRVYRNAYLRGYEHGYRM
jgi:hypothetical protein